MANLKNDSKSAIDLVKKSFFEAACLTSFETPHPLSKIM